MEGRFRDEPADDDDEGNPFSFKNFLQSSKQTDDDKENVDIEKDDRIKARKTLVIVDEDSSNLDAVCAESLYLNSSENDNIPNTYSPDLQSQLPILPEIISKTDEMSTIVPETVADLPDFCCDELSESMKTKLKEFDLINNSLEKSRDDNKKLIVELHSKNARIDELEKEVQRLKCREAEDLMSLEQMVQQVEQNLKHTTERALFAESTISKQHQEIKVLQDKVNMLQKEKQHYLENIRLAAEQFSAKLIVAADGAESSLKSLLEGVEQLRTLSSVAASISKIHEESS